MSDKRKKISLADDARDRRLDYHARPPTAAAPEFVNPDDEGTGRVEGEALKKIRARRPTSKRLEKLEEKQDKSDEKLGAIELAVADIRGDQKAQNVALESIEKKLDRADAREDVEFVDAVAARKAKREAVLKVALYIITGGLVGKILHTLGML